MTGGGDWTAHARRLADSLRDRGDLRSTRWYRAVAEVPRHLLVPTAYEQDAMGRWVRFETAEALERVYSCETLITALADVDGQPLAVSSSSKPDLVVRMLEILQLLDGHRVLEIGTGTGYNAALMTHRLGAAQVCSVDIDRELVVLARRRLAAAGFHPTLVTGDGALGLAARAPFDRIVATCSVRSVPWSWAEQLADSGAILVDLKLAVSAGNLVYLHRVADRLEGRFTARWAAFMAMRPPTPTPPVDRAPRAHGGRTRLTTTPATPWTDASQTWFLAQLRLPPGTSFGYELDPGTRRPTAATLGAPDGSWARVGLYDRTATEAGPTSLWSSVEWAHDQWNAAGRPDWTRLGLTVTADGAHRVWLDHPTSNDGWNLPLIGRP